MWYLFRGTPPQAPVWRTACSSPTVKSLVRRSFTYRSNFDVPGNLVGSDATCQRRKGTPASALRLKAATSSRAMMMVLVAQSSDARPRQPAREADVEHGVLSSLLDGQLVAAGTAVCDEKEDLMRGDAAGRASSAAAGWGTASGSAGIAGEVLRGCAAPNQGLRHSMTAAIKAQLGTTGTDDNPGAPNTTPVCRSRAGVENATVARTALEQEKSSLTSRRQNDRPLFPVRLVRSTTASDSGVASDVQRGSVATAAAGDTKRPPETTVAENIATQDVTAESFNGVSPRVVCDTVSPVPTSGPTAGFERIARKGPTSAQESPSLPSIAAATTSLLAPLTKQSFLSSLTVPATVGSRLPLSCSATSSNFVEATAFSSTKAERAPVCINGTRYERFARAGGLSPLVCRNIFYGGFELRSDFCRSTTTGGRLLMQSGGRDHPTGSVQAPLHGIACTRQKSSAPTSLPELLLQNEPDPGAARGQHPPVDGDPHEAASAPRRQSGTTQMFRLLLVSGGLFACIASFNLLPTQGCDSEDSSGVSPKKKDEKKRRLGDGWNKAGEEAVGSLHFSNNQTNWPPTSWRGQMLARLEVFFEDVSDICYEFFDRTFPFPSASLLPDAADLNYPPNLPTLVVDLDKVIVKMEYDRKHGWRVVKRPGADYFFKELAYHYEIVVWSEDNFPVAQEVCNKWGIPVVGALHRDQCRRRRGHYIKDLNRLGRDLKRTIIVDHDPVAFSLQPDNGILLREFDGNPSDQDLIHITDFLRLAAESPEMDLRDFLKSFGGGDTGLVKRWVVYCAKRSKEVKSKRYLGSRLFGSKDPSSRWSPSS